MRKEWREEEGRHKQDTLFRKQQGTVIPDDLRPQEKGGYGSLEHGRDRCMKGNPRKQEEH